MPAHAQRVLRLDQLSASRDMNWGFVGLIL